MNLVILYPDFFFRTPLDTSGALESTAHPARNLIAGARQYFYQSDQPYATQVNFITDATALASDERALQYVYVGGLNLIAQEIGNSAIVVDGADNNTFSTNVYSFSESNIEPPDLYGRAQEDYVIEAPVENSRGYWRVYLTTSGAGTCLIQARTLYAGRWFYWDVEPEAPVNEFYRETGGRRDKRTLQISWKGVSDAKVHEFSERILRHREYNHVVLYTRTWHTILDDERVFPAYVTNFQVERLKTDRNTVIIEFTECI